MTSLIAGLEAKQIEIEQDRQVLRLTMAAVEGELIQLTRQQAELQKLQIALDQVLKHLKENAGDGHVASAHGRCTGLADSAVPGTA